MSTSLQCYFHTGLYLLLPQWSVWACVRLCLLLLNTFRIATYAHR